MAHAYWNGNSYPEQPSLFLNLKHKKKISPSSVGDQKKMHSNVNWISSLSEQTFGTKNLKEANQELGVTSTTKKSIWEKEWIFYGFQGNILILFMLVIAPLSQRKNIQNLMFI